MHRTPLILPDATAALEQLRPAISVYVFVFLSLSFFLTALVSRNLTRPFKEIVQTLKWVRNGRFDKKVRVTSNDEIGYTGDVINEMTDGLIERERMQQSLNLAKEVQQNLLPKSNLKFNGFDIAGKSVYCDETGGDYYNSEISFGLSIMLGAPGETPETISETFRIVDSYPMIQSIWVNIGLFLWTHHQKVLDAARRDGQLKNDRELFDGAYYISPELPKDYMISLIESLKTRENCTVQVNKPYREYYKAVNFFE
jgi:HAMP domain-containing protein